MSALSTLRVNDLTIASIKCFIRQCLNSKNSIATVFPQGKQRDYSIIHSGESVIAKHKNGRYANLIDNLYTIKY